MSNKIDVETQAIRNVAADIDTYITSLLQKRERLLGYESELSAAWRGEDATKFQKRYNAVVKDTGFTMDLIKVLRSYRDYLNYCAQSYEDAANSAVNRINSVK
ncbi:MAG: WXG100 family type VII secretion target [Lachnospiraceae bacterium]|nr:WXG100 family type VII secretion target [Lachnospiraceae bacterium]